MDDDVKANTLAWYRSLYNDDKIMMASAIDGIVDCELGDSESAWESLCDLLPHVRGPFMLVSERPINECLSFITGLGGLLQLVVMGFAGFAYAMTISKPAARSTLPAAVGGMRIHGAHINGNAIDIICDADGVRQAQQLQRHAPNQSTRDRHKLLTAYLRDVSTRAGAFIRPGSCSQNRYRSLLVNW